MTTYGEYIKTKAAQTEADSKTRKNINKWVRDGFKLIKYKKGSRGSLDYGKTVLMFSHESVARAKPYIFVMRWNYGLVHSSNNLESKIFKLKTAAEKQYQTWARGMD